MTRHPSNTPKRGEWVLVPAWGDRRKGFCMARVASVHPHGIFFDRVEWSNGAWAGAFGDYLSAAPVERLA